MPTSTIVCIVGRSESGKTTLIEKLLRELKQRGHRVATIKHHTHPGLQIDRPGKDTWRHAQAGSDYIVIAGPDIIISIQRVSREPSLDEIAQSIPEVDIILAEGYKRSPNIKIEVVRAARSELPICGADELLAIATDVLLPLQVPQYGLDDAAGLVDLLETLIPQHSAQETIGD